MCVFLSQVCLGQKLSYMLALCAPIIWSKAQLFKLALCAPQVLGLCVCVSIAGVFGSKAQLFAGAIVVLSVCVVLIEDVCWSWVLFIDELLRFFEAILRPADVFMDTRSSSYILPKV